MQKPIVVLLAGGASNRFWPFSDKNLLSIFGKPFLFHQVEALKQAGFSDIVVVSYGDTLNASQHLDIVTVEQKQEGMAGAVLSAEVFIKDRPTVVVIANDAVEPRLFKTVFETAVENKTNALVGYQTNTYLPMGYIVSQNNSISSIIEKPGEGKQPSNLVTISSHVFLNGSTLVSHLKKTKSTKDDRYEKTLEVMMRNEEFKVLPYQGPFAYLKYPWHILLVMNHFLERLIESHIDPKATIHPSATITGPVWIEEGVVVMEYAKITGPCYIGSNTIIGNHTMIRQSHIGRDCVIGFGSDVTRSYIGALSWLHTNYVGDSVLGDNVSMGSGTVLANLRLDEKEISSEVKGEKISTHETKCGAMIGNNVRIGVNTSIMPGIKIGMNSSIGAGVILSRDVPDGIRCFLKQEQLVSKQKTEQISSDRSTFKNKLTSH